MNVIAGIDAARERWNVLEHPFYTRWRRASSPTRSWPGTRASTGTPSWRSRARRGPRACTPTRRLSTIALWATSPPRSGPRRRPLPETRCCASAWAAADEELGAAAILYAIESGQPTISETKLRGLVDHYGFAEGSEAVEYFVLHGERDHEHAAEARTRLEEREDARLVGLAEAALAANWALLDGVSTAA